MPEGVGSTMIESNAAIGISNEVLNLGTNGDIVWRKTSYKNRLIGRPWPLIAQIVSNRLAGKGR